MSAYFCGRNRVATKALRAGSIAITASLANCVAMPVIPNDDQFPTQEILRYTVCELRDAYRDLSDKSRYPNFDAGEYSVKVSLQPKVDHEVTVKGGLTGKSTGLVKRYSNTWLFGSATAGGSPGAGIDVRSHQDGSISFIVKSAILLSEKTHFNCETGWSPAKHSLAQNLDLRSWVTRSAFAVQGDLRNITSVDSQGFFADIYVKVDGGGGFTYLFPLGTNFLTASGQYWTTHTLTVNITDEPPKRKISVITIPATTGWRNYEVPLSAPIRKSTAVSQDTRNRLDALQLEQTLRNLNIRITQ